MRPLKLFQPIAADINRGRKADKADTRQIKVKAIGIIGNQTGIRHGHGKESG